MEFFNAFELSFLTKDFPQTHFVMHQEFENRFNLKNSMRLCCFYGYLAHVFYWLVSYESQLHSFRYFMFSHILRPTLLDCLNINLNCRKLFQRTNPSIADYHFIRLLSNEYTAYKKFRIRSLWV